MGLFPNRIAINPQDQRIKNLDIVLLDRDFQLNNTQPTSGINGTVDNSWAKFVLPPCKSTDHVRNYYGYAIVENGEVVLSERFIGAPFSIPPAGGEILVNTSKMWIEA